MRRKLVKAKRVLVLIKDKRLLDTVKGVLKKRSCEIACLFKRREHFDFVVTDSFYVQRKLMRDMCDANLHTPVLLATRLKDKNKVPAKLQTNIYDNINIAGLGSGLARSRVLSWFKEPLVDCLLAENQLSFGYGLWVDLMRRMKEFQGVASNQGAEYSRRAAGSESVLQNNRLDGVLI